MKFGFFGGSFNPVHIGHIEIARKAIAAFSLDRLFFIPSAKSPGKKVETEFPFYHRWEMLRLAISDLDKCELASLEFYEEKLSFTADSLEKLIQRYPDDEIYLILGEDVFASLAHWYRYDYIRKHAQIIVFQRNYQLIDVSRSGLDNCLSVKFDCHISSEEIRNHIKSALYCSDCLPDLVKKYIYSYSLYMSSKEKDAISYIKMHQKPNRFMHTLGVAFTAERLANILNVNPIKARYAALLHDCAKELPLPALNELCNEIENRYNSFGILQVMHAPAGAVLAKRLFNIDEDIFSAILFHCTLAPSVSLLDKIIYISDLIEPGRKYPSIKILQEMSFQINTEKDLNRLIILAIEKNLCYIVDNGMRVHPYSEQALIKLRNDQI